MKTYSITNRRMVQRYMHVDASYKRERADAIHLGLAIIANKTNKETEAGTNDET